MEKVKIFYREDAKVRRALQILRVFVPSRLYIFLLFCLIASPALAVDKTEPSTYSPDFCEFGITFPGEPYKIQRCDKDDPKKCYDMVSYTQVYELSSTVNFRVICSPVGPDIIKNYSPEVMEATLRAMTDRNVIKMYDTSFREEEGYKQAGLVGEGKSGRTSTIYIAQLWIGAQSAFSVEAELIGAPSEAADEMFSEVLKSVNYSGVKKTPEEIKKEKEEKKKKKKKKE